MTRMVSIESDDDLLIFLLTIFLQSHSRFERGFRLAIRLESYECVFVLATG